MEWEIPVLNDLNMATFAATCGDGSMPGGAVMVCGAFGSAASNCAEGSSPGATNACDAGTAPSSIGHCSTGGNPV